MQKQPNKITRQTYDDMELNLLTAAAQMVSRHSLTVGYAAEALSRFYPNRSIKAIELRLARSLREMKGKGHVTLKVSEHEENKTSTLNTTQEVVKKEEVLDPFDLVLGMIETPIQESTILTTTPAETISKPVISDYTVNLDKRDKVILPHFNHSHVGLKTNVRIMHITEYGFFAENGTHTGLVHVSSISRNYLNHQDLLCMFNVGDELEVVVETNPFNINKVLLKPTTYDQFGNIVLLNKTNTNTVLETSVPVFVEPIVLSNYSETIDLSKLDDDMLSIFSVHLESNLLTSSLKHHVFSCELNEANKTISVEFDTTLSDEEISEFKSAVNESIDFLI